MTNSNTLDGDYELTSSHILDSNRKVVTAFCVILK